MKIHPREDDLNIATFGRALWILDDINPLRALAKDGTKLLEKEFDVFDGAPGYQVTYRSYDGVRFSGQSEFKGDNKNLDRIPINIWKKPVPKKTEDAKKVDTKESEKKVADKKEGDKKDEDKKDKATFKIYNSKGEIVREYKRKLEDGLNKITWGMEENGILYPSRSEPKEEDDLPGGMDAMPGEYKVVVLYGKSKDSTMVTIKADPRNKTKEADKLAIRKTLKDYESIVTEARKSYDFIRESRKSIELVNKLLDLQTDTIKKEFKNTHKTLNSKLDSLSNLYMGPENVKGIQRNPNELNSILYDAQSYIESSWIAPQANALVALDKARKAAETTNAAVNVFKMTEWTKYMDKVKAMQVKVFKE
jgi:hypothetical protein